MGQKAGLECCLLPIGGLLAEEGREGEALLPSLGSTLQHSQSWSDPPADGHHVSSQGSPWSRR